MSSPEKEPLLSGKVIGQLEKERSNQKPYWIRFVVLILFNIPYTAAFSITYQFCYRVVAIKYGLSFDSADNGTADSNFTYCGQKINETRSDLQAQVDAETSNWLLYYSLASGIPAILTTITFGSLSDYVGRKFMFVICNIGVLIKCAVLVAMIQVKLTLSWGYLGFVLEGFSGSGFVLLLATFAYTADVTSIGAQRQFGVALMEGINTFAGGLASFAIGYIIDSLGFLVPSVICCCILLTNIFVIMVFLPETIVSDGSIKQFPNGIKNILNLYVKDNGKKRRGKLILLILAFASVIHSLFGTSGVSTIYKLSEPFCFSSFELGIYGAVSSIATNFIGIPLIKVYQRIMSAPIVSAFGTVFDLFGNLLTTFAANKFMIYLVPVCDIFVVVVAPMIRGSMSNLVSPEEQGALFGSIAAVEATSYFTSSSLASAIYSHTVARLRGAVYLCFCAFDVVSIILFILYQCIYEKKNEVANVQHG